jgi:WD40 repeat protein
MHQDRGGLTMRRPTSWAVCASPRHPIGLASLALLALVVASGCRKEKDSLIIASVTASDSGGAALTSLTLSVGGVSQTFALTGGLTTTALQFGLYVSSDVTGSHTVTASATEATGCRGYKGEQPVDVASAGSTVMLAITMMPGTVCQNDGGAGAGASAGAGGGVGPGGSGGHAGSGAGGSPPGQPPSLQTCTEYEHNDPASTCTYGETGDTYVWGVAFSPNGQLLVTGGDDGRVVVWRFDGRTPTAEGHVFSKSGRGIVAFSPDGAQLAIGWDGEIDLYTVASWSLSRTLTVANTIVDLTFTSDGQQIVSADTDGTVGNVYSHSALAGGSTSPGHTLALTQLPNQIAVGPGAAGAFPVAVATGDGNVGIYSLTSAGFQGPSNTLSVSTDGGAYTVRISPSGNVLASAGADGVVYLWQFPITSVTPTMPNLNLDSALDSDTIVGLAFSPSGSYIGVASGFFQAASIWGVSAPRSLLSSYTNESWDMLSIAFTPSGNAIAGGEFDCGVFLVCAD